MAQVTTRVEIDPGVWLVTVQGTTASGTSEAFRLPRCNKITIQPRANGTGFNAATFTLQVSNDDVTFFAVPTTVQFTDATVVKAVTRDGIGWRYYRLSWSGGAAGTDATFFIVGSLVADD